MVLHKNLLICILRCVLTLRLLVGACDVMMFLIELHNGEFAKYSYLANGNKNREKNTQARKKATEHRSWSDAKMKYTGTRHVLYVCERRECSVLLLVLGTKPKMV